MIKITLLSLILFFSIQLNSFAQKIKSESIEYEYIRLPHQPLNESIKNYQASVFATYEEENTRLKNEYEAEKKKADAEFEQAKADYPAKVKANDDKYNSEMEEYNKKSLADKVIEKKVMGEDNKPVKQTVPQPYLRHVSEPKLKTSYDYPVVTNTYINVGGLNNQADNALIVKVTIYGYDYTQPVQKTEQKKMSSYANGQSSSSMVNYYHTEFTYRHPMSVSVTLPDGTVLINETPQELNTYTTYKSPESDKSSSVNSEVLIKTNEEAVFQKNLTFINNLVNDKIGFMKTQRKAELFYIKEKSDVYNDLYEAYNDATSGLKLIAENETDGKAKIENAVKLFEAALKESNLEDKKARIDKDVTTMIYFNLLECYFSLRNETEGRAVIDKMKTTKLSYDEKKSYEAFDALYNDLKKRLASNKK